MRDVPAPIVVSMDASGVWYPPTHSVGTIAVGFITRPVVTTGRDLWLYLTLAPGSVAQLFALYAFAASVLALPTALLCGLHHEGGLVPHLIGRTLGGASAVPYVILSDLLGLLLLTLVTAVAGLVVRRKLEPMPTLAAYAVVRAVARFALIVVLMGSSMPVVGPTLVTVFALWTLAVHVLVARRLVATGLVAATLVVTAATTMHLAILVAVA